LKNGFEKSKFVSEIFPEKKYFSGDLFPKKIFKKKIQKHF